MKFKTWSKKRKALFFGILAAVVLLAAGTAAWLLWGQEKPPQRYLLDISQYDDISDPVYMVQNGLGTPRLPLERYRLTGAPEGYTHWVDSSATACRFSFTYEDQFYNPQGTLLTLSQSSAVQERLVRFPARPVEQVEFAGMEVLYSSDQEQTTAAWIVGDTLFTLECYLPMTMEEILEWVNLVDYQSPEIPPIAPLQFVEGENRRLQTTQGESEVYRSWMIGGNPELPQTLDYYSFRQTPEGFSPAQTSLVEDLWPLDDNTWIGMPQGQFDGIDTGNRTDWIQSYENGEGDTLTLVNCVADGANHHLFEHIYSHTEGSASSIGDKTVETVTVNGMEGRLYHGHGFSEEDLNYTELVLLGDYLYLKVIYVGDISSQDLLELAQGIGR